MTGTPYAADYTATAATWPDAAGTGAGWLDRPAADAALAGFNAVFERCSAARPYQWSVRAQQPQITRRSESAASRAAVADNTPQ